MSPHHNHDQPTSLLEAEKARGGRKGGQEGEWAKTHLAATNDALVLVVAKGALVADADEGRGPHVAVADGALAVALIAEAADGDARLLAAHDEIAARLVLAFGLFTLWGGGGGDGDGDGDGDERDVRVMARHGGRGVGGVCGVGDGFLVVLERDIAAKGTEREKLLVFYGRDLSAQTAEIEARSRALVFALVALRVR